MRTTPLMAATLLAAACASENELRYTATLQAETNGVVLSDDGLDGFAAMSGTTCTIDVNWGCPIADQDLPTVDEAVVDHHGEVTLGVSEEGVHTIRGGLWDEGSDIPVAGIRTGRLADGGPVMLGGSLEDCWIQQGDVRGGAPGAACDDGAHHAVDRATGTLFVAADQQLWALTAGEPERSMGPADLIAWDAGVRRLYAASVGDTEIVALEPSGAVAWTEQTRDPIVDVAARGDLGEVLVLVERADGLGSLERRDGETGRVLGRSALPTADGTLVASLNGVRVALVRDGEVSFFALETDNALPVVDDTPADCVAFEFASGQPLLD
jgi:hypothetical protein